MLAILLCALVIPSATRTPAMEAASALLAMLVDNATVFRAAVVLIKSVILRVTLVLAAALLPLEGPLALVCRITAVPVLDVATAIRTKSMLVSVTLDILVTDASAMSSNALS